MAGAENSGVNFRHSMASAIFFDIRRALFALIDVNYLSPFVVTAFWTHAVLDPRLLTILTHDGLRRSQRIMRAALTAACFRVTAFWVWHNYSVRFSISDFGFLISFNPGPS